jgi:hypothetical protein
MSGLVIGGWLMARSALAASRLLPGASGSDTLFLRDKIGTARFYAGQLLPQAASLLPGVTAGAGPLFQIDLSRESPRVTVSGPGTRRGQGRRADPPFGRKPDSRFPRLSSHCPASPEAAGRRGVPIDDAKARP